MKKSYTFLLAFAAFAACRQQPQQSMAVATDTPPQHINKFSDATLRELYTLQDERKTAELLNFLNHPKPQYRREAALAFASVQDTLAIPQLLTSLSDTSTSIRMAAAYALGQIGHKKAQQPIIRHLQQEQRPTVQAEALEALGKLADSGGLNFLVNYQAANETAQAGQAWGLYRAGLRQISSAQAVEKAVQWLTESKSYEVRLAAAHLLARTPKLDLTPYRQQLTTVVTSDESADVRMAVAQAFSKVNARDKASLLSGIVQSDPDYRVRLSAIRSMAGLEFEDIDEAILAGLTDQNINTAVATAEFLQANHADVDSKALRTALAQVEDGRVRAGLIWVILRNSPDKAKLSQEYQQLYLRTENPYDKAHLLKALSADYSNHQFIAKETFAATQPVIGTYGMEALAAMRQQGDFPKALEQNFADIFKQGIASGDVSLAGLAAGVIRNPKLNFRKAYRDHAFLTEAQQKLVLPRDMETNIELQKTIDYLSGKEQSETPQNPFTHPIDWQFVQTIHPDQQVVIETEKGTITLELFVEDAPGSVANFVELVNKQFFDGLYFHRVVPNFVAQGGDKRGDGWGSSDYSIRSEFAPLHYREGYVGMASAGKDTESNQWFITHSPTPHLDGRYTIFAKVVEGMEVVHKLEVGDKISQVNLILRAKTR
ncbi:peptidylprolyl isomerase [Pontibacter virosus]|uniref:peptidylprolyl isomerase n=1 Tax=Pontibacter virosus TaxID=1765052 RepID=A0A2U1B3M5_9BACT|nr:peptidylprolyl isomerase [Pontibacter virosus]PVY43280.1 cyclophilin family peptidyl-prolyl cis-trans isomerase [Pontibacter virosus]